MRNPFTAIAFSILKPIQCTTPKPVFSSLIVLTTFAISGVFHALATDNLTACSAYAQFRYYMSIGIALLLEDAFLRSVQLMTSSISEPNRASQLQKEEDRDSVERQKALKSARQRPPFKFRVIGYAWVVLFDVWATSKLVFLDIQCSAR